jgi:polysaccharide biosynthesis protein PslH
MRPHVLYVTPIFGYPPFGGPRLRTYHTLRALARCADVTLYLTQQPDTPDRVAAREHVLSFCRNLVWPDPPLAPMGGRLRSVARALLPAGVRARLRRRVEQPNAAVQTDKLDELTTWVQAHQPDLIWLGFGGISYQLVPLKERTGVLLVIETECVWSRFILREQPFESDAQRRAAIEREGRAKQAEERFGALHADLTTAVSEVDADYFRALAPDAERVMLLHNVIDVDAYQRGEPRVALQQPAFVFAGSMSRGTANVDATRWLVEVVLPQVWRSRPDVHLYLVGRDPAPEVIACRGPRVHVTGEVANIVPYLRACAAALVPLRWESGTRFKILEAFACHAPVISTTLGAEGLAVENGRHLLLADEPEAFAAAMLAVLQQPALARSMVGPAYDLVRREYDVSSAERQIGSILTQLGFPIGASASV